MPKLLSLVLSIAIMLSFSQNAFALATAQGVALNSNASCEHADLDITLTTINATREGGLVTNLTGDILDDYESSTTLDNFSGTYVGYGLSVNPSQPPSTLIGSYAYVGNTPPSPSDTAEFFILYNCSTRQVLFSCYGAYGTCPQTAQQAYQMLASVPTMTEWGMIMFMVLAGLGAVYYLRRQRRAES